MTRSSTRRIPTEGDANLVAQSIQSDGESTAKEGRSLSPAKVDAPKNNKFHGPSSELFDEDAPSIGHQKDVNSGDKPLEPLSSKLIAEAVA